MVVRCILFVILFGLLNSSERHIGLIIQSDYKGEHSLAYRIQAACRNLHWKADVIDLLNPKELKENNYDFVILLVPGLYEHPPCKNYLAIFDPVHHYFDEAGCLKKQYQAFDGYLMTYDPSRLGRDKKAFPSMIWLPTMHKREFQKNTPTCLFHTLCHWGNRYDDQKFKQLFKLLDKTSYMKLYGLTSFRPLYPLTYQKPIPFDDHTLYELAAKSGIVLILHSSDHNIYGLPSGRIFEAAASSTVIISDQNSFVKTHFGDTVLYINTDEDALSIYNQIQHQMEWIANNKTEAIEKARRAHAIYLEKFLLEDQLLQLEQFHKKISNENAD
jgi:hypothetical protein